MFKQDQCLDLKKKNFKVPSHENVVPMLLFFLHPQSLFGKAIKGSGEPFKLFKFGPDIRDSLLYRS